MRRVRIFQPARLPPWAGADNPGSWPGDTVNARPKQIVDALVTGLLDYWLTGLYGPGLGTWAPDPPRPSTFARSRCLSPSRMLATAFAVLLGVSHT